MTSLDAAATTPVRSYEKARTDAAMLALDDRALIVATGPQRQKLIHGLVSNDVAGRTPGQGCRAALMDAKGHLLSLLRVLVGPSEVVLEAAGSTRDEVLRRLEHYRVAAPVRLAPTDEIVIGLAGPRVLERLRGLDAGVPELPPEAHVPIRIGGHTVRLVRAGDLPAGGWVLHVPAESAAEIRAGLESAGFETIGPSVADALRIEDGRPWYGVDVTAANLLHETGLVAEVHSSTKGCYVGQEVIARLEARGANVHQKLRGFALSEARPAETRLLADGQPVGVLTTTAVSPRTGPIAMGYVHRDHQAEGTVLDAGGARAVVAALPLTR